MKFSKKKNPKQTSDPMAKKLCSSAEQEKGGKNVKQAGLCTKAVVLGMKPKDRSWLMQPVLATPRVELFAMAA